ncbi:MAG: tetratricopeptide repeat protein [Chloroflexi bacterium]|nr:tetratricopeptide repeat protein [Chloroflexota bacterium]
MMNNCQRMRNDTRFALETLRVGKTLRVLPLVLAALLLLAACSQEAAPPEPLVFAPTATLPPTPTLASGALGSIPTPPVTPLASSSGGSGGDTAVAANTANTSSATIPPPADPVGPTPVPAQRLELGQQALQVADYAAAAAQFAASLAAADALTPAQRQEAQYNLAVAHLQDGRYAEAITAFNQLLADATAAAFPTAHFMLGQAYQAQGQYAQAVTAYQTYLDANSDTAAYVAPIIADNYLALGDRAAALAAYETAVQAPAHRLTAVANRLKLAEFYLADANYPAAIAQYDAARDQAQTEATKGQMTYLAGSAELLTGNSEAAYQRFLSGVSDYPGAYESYQGLVALVNAGVPVDSFQRGLVNLNAQSYQPAVNAFTAVIANNPESYRPDTHLYLARAYEGIGDLAAALVELDKLAAADGPLAAIERAKMLARAGDRPGALAAYQSYLEQYPAGADAPSAAWQTAVLLRRAGDIPAAVTAYTNMTRAYPGHADAPEALFEAAWLAYGLGDGAAAVALWQQAANAYPFAEFGNESMLWLLRVLPEMIAAEASEGRATAVILPTPEPGAVPTVTPPSPPVTSTVSYRQLYEDVRGRAAASTLSSYGAIRAHDMATEAPPFARPAALVIPPADSTAQNEAEAWLRGYLGLEPDAPVRTLAPELAYDQRLITGEKLWRMGLLESAKRELEALRQEAAGNPLWSYQLALYFRDLGLYRSSILAATSVLAQANISVFDAPRFIGRLSYPVYYADQILALADSYGYDPLLQFALIRQESLYESFARSGAAAQGLSQVIPDTGAYIAQRLNWPNFVNEDLYKPHVGLAFGAYYLDQQLDAFDGHAHAALSAYNAGPGNAARWYATAGGDIDVFKETVDFAETRLYIERIYVGQAIYRFLYGIRS